MYIERKISIINDSMALPNAVYGTYDIFLKNKNLLSHAHSQCSRTTNTHKS